MTHKKAHETGYTKNAPSLVVGNLVASGGKFIYAHKDRVCVYSEKEFKHEEEGAVEKVELRQRVHTIRSARLPALAQELGHGGNVVLFTTDSAVSVWNATCERCLFTSRPNLPAREVTNVDGTFFRGICVCSTADGGSQLCFGTSQGTIHVYTVLPDGSFAQARSASQVFAFALPGDAFPVLALESPAQSGAASTSCELACSCENGGLTLWDAASLTGYGKRQFVPTDAPVVAMAYKGDFLAVGLSDGRVCLFSQGDCVKRFEITAHSRWLSVLVVHQTLPWMLTAAQDGTLALWKLPDSVDGEVDVLHSTCWHNGMITGAAFCGPKGTDVAVTSYDWDEIRLIRTL